MFCKKAVQIKFLKLIENTNATVSSLIIKQVIGLKFFQKKNKVYVGFFILTKPHTTEPLLVNVNRNVK